MFGQIGYVYHILGEYEAAIYYHEKELQYAWDAKIKGIETKIYDNIGIEYYYLGELEKSTYYHNLSMGGKQTFDEKAKKFAPKCQEREMEEFKRDYLIKAGNWTSLTDDFITGEYHRIKNIRVLDKMRYLKQRDFSEELTMIQLEKIKAKIYRDLVPSPRRLASQYVMPEIKRSVPNFKQKHGSLSYDKASQTLRDQPNAM